MHDKKKNRVNFKKNINTWNINAKDINLDNTSPIRLITLLSVQFIVVESTN